MIAPPTPVPTVTKTISATNGLMKEQLKLRNLPRAFWSAQKHPEAEEIQVFMMVKVVFHDVSSSLAVSASLSSQHASCQPQLLSKPGANKLETYGKTTGKKTVVEQDKHPHKPHKDDKSIIRLLLSILVVPADWFQGLQ